MYSVEYLSFQFISEHQQDFVNYINDPNVGQGQPSAGQPYSIAVSPRERDEINQVSRSFSQIITQMEKRY